MELLLLFLLAPTILVQGDGKSNDPNDEPFLPIYPVYPYNPKLIKRGTDRETATQLSPELYAPKVDAKDSYSASYTANYPRDPYYPNYNPYPKVSSSSGYSYYSTIPYSYQTTPYNTYTSYSSPYSASPPTYASIPYSSSYPNLYYQHPYYYPGHYSQSLFPPPPPPPLPLPGTDYTGDPYSDQGSTEKNRDKNGDKRYRDSDVNQEPVGNQFVDGGNYISGNPKDLDSQPSTYKTSSPQNQLNQDPQIKNLPIPLPKTTYRVISVAGQPVGPDYPLPSTYVKAQQLEELVSHTWAKLLAQNLQQQNAQNAEQDATKVVANQNDQGNNSQRLLAYLVNPSILGKLNVAQTVGQLVQAPTTRLKNIKYPPLTPGVYTAVEKPEKDQTESEYENYENSSSQGAQDYDASSSQNDKQPQSYENDSARSVSYQNQNFVTVETPRRYNYQYSNYNPSQTITQQQSQQYKNNLDDSNFGAKTKNG
ncbi:uncharacterized protein LOC117604244 [Osmia lignaria lignaria]|uniref:uncharacterized protein LOC117604244 n=1 Tax=Osmia lignaria lignaria TaxID=1437193 RepID=UPI001478D7F3|nr:uncharacterized protein LOC117604244 [Osmia lignaria]